MELLSLDNPPMVFPLTLTGLEKNADGLYKMDDVAARFEQALRAYDALLGIVAQASSLSRPQ